MDRYTLNKIETVFQAAVVSWTLLTNMRQLACRIIQQNDDSELVALINEFDALDPNTPMGMAWKTLQNLCLTYLRQLLGKLARADEGEREALINEFDALDRTTPLGRVWQTLKNDFRNNPEVWQAINTPEGWQTLEAWLYNPEA